MHTCTQKSKPIQGHSNARLLSEILCQCAYYNLPTPGTGEQGVLGVAPCWTEADTAALSGGPPGAERGTGSVGRAMLGKV